MHRFGIPTLDSRKLAIMGLLVVLAIGTAVSLRLVNPETKEEDAYYTWVEGQRLLNGENSYGLVDARTANIGES